MPVFRADLMSHNDARQHARRRWIGGVVLIVLVAILFFVLMTWRYFLADIPPLPDDLGQLGTASRAQSLLLQDRNGKILATRGPQFGLAVQLEDLPAFVPQAFLAIEDRQFFSHHGIALRALIRAAVANARAGHTVQGGSTITQQLVKLLFLTPQQTIKRKVQEIWLATRLEKRLNKKQILQLYLNRVYFGSGAYGIDAAARRYFSKPAGTLTLPEAALLAALPKAPSRLAPDQHREAAQMRADLVLRNMMQAGFITAAKSEEALASPPRLHLPGPMSDHGYIFDMAAQEARMLAGNKTRDLIITTTIDPGVQKIATTALEVQLDKSGKALHVAQGAIVVLDTHGALRALVGGRSYVQSKYNRAIQAKRQPGSAFKAFVYAAALEKGIDFDAVRYDEPIKIEGWAPKNYGGGFRGRVTLRDAFKRSINTIAVQLAEEISPQAVVALARRFGIHEPLLPLPSIALGAQEVNLLELTRAYGVFANDGVLYSAYLVTKIETPGGETLYLRPPIKPARVYPMALARQMSTLMQEVVLAGTGHRAALSGGRQVAGKTGTSQDWRDAWFVGFSADYVAGVWVGNDDNAPMKRVTGGGLPAQIWRTVISQAMRHHPRRALNASPPHVRSDAEEKLAAFYTSLREDFAKNAKPGLGQALAKSAK